MTAQAKAQLPEGTLVSWYGDDFTGAAAVMEVLTFSGLPAVLFLDIPTAPLLQRFKGYRGVGIAGAARSYPPDWMETNLPAAFAAMATTNAPINHYKICSTLDSSPFVGSVGRAVELAGPVLGGTWHPLVVAAPQIGRYQAFGNLFARAGKSTFRLDRHPTMSKHPVTPMHEADVRLHLRQQTQIPIGLVDIEAVSSRTGQSTFEEERAKGKVLLAIDVLDERSLIEAGRLIWKNRGEKLLAVGSQGVEYALTAYWQDRGLLAAGELRERLEPVDRLVAVSGSCSPVTADQISNATENGFTGLRMDPACAVETLAWENELARVSDEALGAICAGKDPLIYTALGPEDPATVSFFEAVTASGRSLQDINAAVGSGLGTLLRRLMERTGTRRAVIAGGDTSSHATKELGVCALTALSLITPGASICAAHPADPSNATFEIALKGGQMGERDYFSQVKNGGI
ncbi:MAG: four-carbon acid sugar kinase family protein [Roseibium sp.]|uniref:four-carbon acid sugar kinase family protein n=1 Tax=Roseibium sp. TaxID=1936156 RepID=UPI003D9C5624